MAQDEYYKTRGDKPGWVVQNFGTVFSVQSVADIGCDAKQLQQVLPPGIRYLGVDLNPSADVVVDLDSGQPLPISDQSYESVVALDILEHLEEIHFVFDELCRIASRYVLISLPNSLHTAINGHFLGKHDKRPERRYQYGKFTKFYGLPYEKPKDRHRWFFSTQGAEDFIHYRAAKNGFRVIDTRYEIDYLPFFKKLPKQLIALFSRRRLLNYFSGTTFFVLERHA